MRASLAHQLTMTNRRDYRNRELNAMGAGKAGRRRLGAVLAIVASVCLVLPGNLPALAARAASSARPHSSGDVTPPPPPGSAAARALRARHHLPAPKQPSVVPGHHLSPALAPAIRTGRLARPAPAPHWPSAGRAITVLTASVASKVGASRTALGARWQRAGRLPVWLKAVQARNAAGPATRVAVAVSGHQATRSVGANGLLFSIANAGSTPAPARVGVRVSYARFAFAYGGGYASRLALFALPACALTTRPRPTCTPAATRPTPPRTG